MLEIMETPTAATPSPGHTSDINTPPAPLHGYSDSWEPFTPRKSARISQQRATNRNRTPSPQPQLSSRHHSDSRHASLGSPKSKKRQPASTMATPTTISPQKKRVPNTESSRRVSGTLTTEGTATAATALGMPGRSDQLLPGRPTISTSAGMLITPAKTPQKTPSDKSKAKIRSIARNLFHDEDEVMPSPRKARTKKYVLDSFTADDEVDETIQIYTDSHERIPEVDRSEENPFYGNHTVAPEPSKRRARNATVSIPGEGKVSLDEAIRREDGMLIVFRGKKQFRKFSDNEEEGGLDEDEGGLESAVDSTSRRPLTRSSIKPRLLFAPKVEEPPVISKSDEEAETDIEDHVRESFKEDRPSTPMELVEDAPGTPEAPRFAPASPPATARTTRYGSKKLDATPMKGKGAARGGKRSPFEGWRRTKSGAAAESSGSKRPGGELESGAAKRTRA